MSIRHVARTVAISAAALACAGAFTTLTFAGTAGATTPASGDQVGQALPISPDPTSGQTVTAGTPFSSGQTIEVTVPANTVLTAHVSVNILECAAPDGVLPTNTAACDENTIQGDTVIPNADGSLAYSNYQVFSLPNSHSLGETGSSPVTCNLTNECVLYIGDDQNDFTQPHFWSQGFYVGPTTNDTGADPGDGTPEVPLAIGLPIAAVGVVGGTVLFQRRRRSAQRTA